MIYIYFFIQAVSSEEVDSTAGFTSKFLKNNCKQKRHGVCLTLSDMDRIKCFVQDFCIQGLIPFIEKQIRILSDQVICIYICVCMYRYLLPMVACKVEFMMCLYDVFYCSFILSNISNLYQT